MIDTVCNKKDLLAGQIATAAYNHKLRMLRLARTNTQAKGQDGHCEGREGHQSRGEDLRFHNESLCKKYR